MANRLERLGERRFDADVKTAKLLNEVYRTLNQSESVRYVIGAMQPIDSEYTKNTFSEGERVCNQLDSKLTDSCVFKYQGSVTNDTHIKARSDIDVLVILTKYHALEKPQVPTSPYTGNPIDDLTFLRAEALEILEAAFPKANVDSSGSKSITLSGGSLRRKVDVVPSNWLNTNKYAETNNGIYRGVEVFDAKKRIRLPNTPFLHNACIEFKDNQTGGGLRKAARLMKSVMFDSEKIDLSSYDIVSIAYNIVDELLPGAPGGELKILESCRDFCSALDSDASFRDSLDVPDGHRRIFCDGHATRAGLTQLTKELDQIVSDVLSENSRSFRKLADARIEY